MGFVKSYIQLFAYSSVTTDEWKNYLFTYFKDKVRHTWMHSDHITPFTSVELLNPKLELAPTSRFANCQSQLSINTQTADSKTTLSLQIVSHCSV